MIAVTPTRTSSVAGVAIALGICSAAIAIAPSRQLSLGLAAAMITAPLLMWTVSRPERWVLLFFTVDLLAPPLPIDIGNAGPHIAVLFAGIGVLVGLSRLPQWRTTGGVGGIAVPLAAFTLLLLASGGLAALYSGASVAAGSLVRVILFGISVYVFFYMAAGPGGQGIVFTRALFWIAVTAAAFACVDFYFQFPAPAGYGPQFVWLDAGVFRRAQGLFYEASTLGNFCSFFLTMVAVAFVTGREERPCSTPALIGGGVVLCAALLLSYSRASLVNVLVALGALAYIRGVRLRRAVLFLSAGAGCAALLVYLARPDFASSYWLRISASFQYLWSAPNQVLSGRVGNWKTLLDFLGKEPWHALAGIGYKTLPYSDFAGERVIADNTYLSLLVETGIVGLGAFVWLNLAILRASLRAARSGNPRAAFFGTWICCFWAGELVQMFSGDLITYWRVLPLYFWALGVAVAATRRSLA